MRLRSDGHSGLGMVKICHNHQDPPNWMVYDGLLKSIECFMMASLCFFTKFFVQYQYCWYDIPLAWPRKTGLSPAAFERVSIQLLKQSATTAEDHVVSSLCWDAKSVVKCQNFHGCNTIGNSSWCILVYTCRYIIYKSMILVIQYYATRLHAEPCTKEWW